MAEVYWIRKPEHTNIFTQGYVGVTSKTAQERFQVHINNSRLKKMKKSVIHKVIIALGAENLVVETVCICSEEYAYDLENKLRPTERIGWNVAIGGTKPPGVKGLPVSEETRKKLSDAVKAREINPEWAKKSGETRRGRKLPNEHRANISKGMIGRKPTEKMLTLLVERNKARTGEKRTDKAKQKQSSSIKEKGYWNTKKANREIWSNADLYYQDYLNGMTAFTTASKYNLGHNKLKSIFNHFSNGWIPSEDTKWLEDFKSEETMNAVE